MTIFDLSAGGDAATVLSLQLLREKNIALWLLPATEA